MVIRFLLVGQFQWARVGVADDIAELGFPLGVLSLLIRGFKNGLKRKVKDNIISVFKTNPQS